MPFRTLCVLITHYRNPLLTQIFTFGLVEFSRSQQVWFTRAAVAAMGDRLVTIGTSRKVGVVPLWERSWVPILYNVAWAETYLHTKWHPNPSSRFTTIDTGQKLGAAIPLFGGGELGPFHTMSSGPRPTALPCVILSHPAVWPQKTWPKIGGSALSWGSWVPI